jgi:hypothetical protein
MMYRWLQWLLTKFGRQEKSGVTTVLTKHGAQVEASMTEPISKLRVVADGI